MKAIIWNGSTIELADKKEPQITKSNHVKIQITAAGICGTDLNIVKGKLDWPINRTIGHEAVGIVVEKGSDVTDLIEGDKVIIDPTQYCGKCFYCRKGLTNFCSHFDSFEVGKAVDGVFSEFYVGEDRFLYKIPTNMTWDTALLAEPLACVLHYIEESDIHTDDTILILGGGPIGILCAFVTSQLAKNTIITELSKFRREYLKKHLHNVYHPNELTQEIVTNITSNRKCSIVIDTIGNQMDNCFQYLSKGGKTVIMGLDPSYSFNFKPFDLLSNGISMLAFGEYHNFMEKAILNLERDLPFSSMITQKFPINNYKEAFNSVLGYDIDAKKTIEINSIKSILLPNGNYN
jgi:threonine dehydrogenase-like Zn-dependent dehydrogenase